MKAPALIAAALVAFTLSAFVAAAEASNHAPTASHDAEYIDFVIAKKQQLLQDLEEDMARTKRISPRRRYYAGTEARIRQLRGEVAELQEFKQTRKLGHE